MKYFIYLNIIIFFSLFFSSFSSAQTLETKLEGTMVEVRVEKGIEDATLRQIFISESPIGDGVRRSLRDHNTYVASLTSIITKEATSVPLSTPSYIAGSLPVGKKLYVNAALFTRAGTVVWINTQGGKEITPTESVSFAINLNPLVVSGNNLTVSGVIDTRIHSDYKGFKLNYSIKRPEGDIIREFTPTIENNGAFSASQGINELDLKTIYSVLLSVTSPGGMTDNKTFVQKFSKEKGFILPVTTEEGRSAFDAQTYKLLAPLPGLSLIRDTDLCLEYKASIAAQGGNTDDIVCDINDFLNFLMKMLIAISAVVLIIRIILAGFSYMTTDIPFLKSSSKGQITTALGGLALALSAWILLNTINPRLISGRVELEGVVFEIDDEYEEMPTERIPFQGTIPSGAIGQCKNGIVTAKTKTGDVVICKDIENDIIRLINDASNAGVNLSIFSGFRSPESQIRLRIQNCGGNTEYNIYQKPSGQCRPPTARPGRSMHQQGLAIDIACDGKTINLTRNPTTKRCFDWLEQNAQKYGLKNLRSENWHWSTNGR